MNEHIYGIVPPMVTPFHPDDTIDEDLLRAETRYLIERAKVHGLAVCGSTGEGHTLSTDETRRVTAVVAEEAAGRVPVITGIIANSTRAVIERGRAVSDLGVAALQVTPVHYLFRPDDDAMVRHFADNLPANVRCCMKLQGREGGVPRPPMPATSQAQKAPIREALSAAGLV